MEIKKVPYTPDQLKILKHARVGFTIYWGCGSLMGGAFLSVMAVAFDNLYFWIFAIAIPLLVAWGAVSQWMNFSKDIDAGHVDHVTGRITRKRIEGTRSTRYFIHVDTYIIKLGRAGRAIHDKVKVGDLITAVVAAHTHSLLEYKIIEEPAGAGQKV